MSDLDPAWLRSFVAIASAGSVTAASREVHRTQSAVSTQLQQLEAAVGARLVERSTRALALTAAGERFLPHARRLLAMQAAARDAVSEVPPAPVWRVGVSEYFLPQRLGGLLAVLREATGDARLELLWCGSARLEALWAAGEVDLAVATAAGTGPLVAPRQARLLRRETLHWVGAPGAAPLGDRSLPLVLLGPDCPVHAIALAALRRAGRAHHVQLSCLGSQAAVSAVRAGWGVACLNESAVPPDLEVLSRTHPRRWPSPGKLAFYLRARPALATAARALQQWSGAAG